MDVTSDEWILTTGRDAMDDAIRVLVTGLSELDDPRQAAKVIYPLPELTLVTVAAIVADCDARLSFRPPGRRRRVRSRPARLAAAVPSVRTRSALARHVGSCIFRRGCRVAGSLRESVGGGNFHEEHSGLF